MVKLVVCSQVKEIKDRFHIMRCISESVSSFRSQCYWSENWITSNNHTGVNIRESWPWDAFRAAIGDEKAPPATPRTWEPFEELDLTVAPTLACKPFTSSPTSGTQSSCTLELEDFYWPIVIGDEFLLIVLNKGIIQWFLIARKLLTYIFDQVLVWLFGYGFISGCPMCVPLDHPISILNQSKEVLSVSDLTFVKILVPQNLNFNSSLIRVLKYFKLGMYAFLRLM